MTGSDATALTFAFTNHTARSVPIGSVQVNVTYGADQAASPVNLDSGAAHGSVPAGARRTATYSFAIPKSELGHVVISVSVESKYPTVVFSGSLAG